METDRAKGGISKLAFVALFVVVAFAGIFSLSILDILPFLKIKQIEFSIKNKHLASLVRNVIKEAAENNILFLKIKKDLITQQLRDKSKYKIENFYITDIDWGSGKVYLNIVENTPLAKLNKKYCLSPNGRIFEDKNCTSLEIEDKSSSWKVGDLYLSIKKIKKILNFLSATKITVKNQLMEVYGNYSILKIKDIDKLNTALVAQRKVEKFFPKDKQLTVINLLGKKAYYVKIIKERADE